LQEDTNICVFFAFPNIKKQANLRLPLHVQKLSVSASGGFAMHTTN